MSMMADKKVGKETFVLIYDIFCKMISSLYLINNYCFFIKT